MLKTETTYGTVTYDEIMKMYGVLYGDLPDLFYELTGDFKKTEEMKNGES